MIAFQMIIVPATKTSSGHEPIMLVQWQAGFNTLVNLMLAGGTVGCIRSTEFSWKGTHEVKFVGGEDELRPLYDLVVYHMQTDATHTFSQRVRQALIAMINPIDVLEAESQPIKTLIERVISLKTPV